MNFPAKLRTMRAARGLTQEQLAEKAKTSAYFISHMETGKMLPSMDLEKRLKEALGWGELEEKAFEILGHGPA